LTTTQPVTTNTVIRH